MKKQYTFPRPLMAIAAAAILSQICPASLSAKNLYINSTDYAVDTIVSQHRVGPGVEYAYYRIPDRPLDIFVLEADLTNPYLVFEVWNGGDVAVAGERPSHRYEIENRPGHDMIAAHNGDFYTTGLGEAGMSRMGLIGAGECIFNPTGQPLFTIDKQNFPRIDHVYFDGTVSADATGKSTRLHTVNMLRLEWETATYDNQLSLYTPAFGTAMHSSMTGGKIAVLAPVAGSAVFPVNTPLKFKVVSVADNPGNAPIPTDGALLFGRGTSADYIAALPVDSEVTLTLGARLGSYADVKDIREAVGGSGHIILRNGEITNINNPDLHPRTFMGINREGTRIYSVVVDGRTPKSAGIDLDDEGRVLQWLGAYMGINLDGGGSSCMVVNGTIRNHNSDGTERAVGNGAILYSTAPADETIASIAFEPRKYRVPVTANFRPTFMGFNKYDLLKTTDLDGVVLTCDPEIGTINERGEFVATDHSAHGYLHASYNGITADQEIYVVPAELSLDTHTYVVDNRRAYPIKVSASIDGHEYSVDPGSATWTTADPQIATVAAGWITGVANGTTTMSAKSDLLNDEITVSVEIPDTDLRTLIAPFNADDYKITQSGGRGISAKADGDGLTLTYTGNGSARGAYINLYANNKMRTYSLPQSIELTINPGDADVQSITTNYENAQGEHSTLYFTRTPVEKNTVSTFSINLADIFDTDDNTCYPVTLSNIRLNMGASKSGQTFTISIPSLCQSYKPGSGVSDIPVADISDHSADEAWFTLQGIQLPQPQPGTLMIHRRNGRGTLVRIP